MPEYDVVVVGGGPAGLVAARYALHAHLNTAILTPELGGKINEPFALRDESPADSVWGAQLIHQFEADVSADIRLTHISNSARRIERTPQEEFQIVLNDGESIVTRAVILATGAAAQRLYVEGEKEFWGKGVSFSAVSHAPFFRGRDVAVVGGGARALIATLELAQLARRVYLIAAHRHMSDLPEATRVHQQNNVSIFSDWEVQSILGDEFVTGIQLVGLNGETRHLPVEGAFIQFALLPNNELVRDLVDLDCDGHIQINHRCETNVPGLFAAGDVTNIYAEQVLVAIGEGAKAALSAWEYLATHH